MYICDFFPSKYGHPLSLLIFTQATPLLARSLEMTEQQEKNIFYLTTLQEFLAHGLSNVIPSFFFCIPSAAAMGRTSLLYSTGAKTQVMGQSEVHRRIKAIILLTGTCTDLSIVFPYSPFFSVLGNDSALSFLTICMELHLISNCLTRKANGSTHSFLPV